MGRLRFVAEVLGLRCAGWRRDLFWLGLGIGLFYFATLWVRPLASPDEARYAEIAGEMAASGSNASATKTRMISSMVVSPQPFGVSDCDR